MILAGNRTHPSLETAYVAFSFCIENNHILSETHALLNVFFPLIFAFFHNLFDIYLQD